MIQEYKAGIMFKIFNNHYGTDSHQSEWWDLQSWNRSLADPGINPQCVDSELGLLGEGPWGTGQQEGIKGSWTTGCMPTVIEAFDIFITSAGILMGSD